MSVVEFPHIIEQGCGLDVYKDTAIATIKGKDIEERTEIFLNFYRRF